MSLVLGYADSQTAIIMSDGRAGENGSVSEYCNKTRKINDNIIIGFVGYLEDSMYFIECIYSELGDKIKNCYIDDFLDIAAEGMNTYAESGDFKSTFLIIGRTSLGKMKTCICGRTTNYCMQIHTLLESKGRILSIGGTIDADIIKKIYTDNFSDKTTSIPYRMVKTIKEVSKLDNSVNENCFKSFI